MNLRESELREIGSFVFYKVSYSNTVRHSGTEQSSGL